jgi:hypothetical protein
MPTKRRPPPSGMLPLGDVDVAQLAGPGSLVAACGFTGDPVDVREPIERQRTSTA